MEGGQVMAEMTNKDIQVKKDLVEDVQGVLTWNKDNDYCCQYQLADMITKVIKDNDIYT